jgi:hypothetical protein
MTRRAGESAPARPSLRGRSRAPGRTRRLPVCRTSTRAGPEPLRASIEPRSPPGVRPLARGRPRGRPQSGRWSGASSRASCDGRQNGIDCASDIGSFWSISETKSPCSGTRQRKSRWVPQGSNAWGRSAAALGGGFIGGDQAPASPVRERTALARRYASADVPEGHRGSTGKRGRQQAAASTLPGTIPTDGRDLSARAATGKRLLAVRTQGRRRSGGAPCGCTSGALP